jgi:hypothetical protein
MIQDDIVAIVRRVYRAGTAPKLGVLIPEDKMGEDGQTRTVLINWIFCLKLDFFYCKKINFGFFLIVKKLN